MPSIRMSCFDHLLAFGSGLSGAFGFSPGDGGDAYFEADESDPVHLLDQALGRGFNG